MKEFVSKAFSFYIKKIIKKLKNLSCISISFSFKKHIIDRFGEKKTEDENILVVASAVRQLIVSFYSLFRISRLFTKSSIL